LAAGRWRWSSTARSPRSQAARDAPALEQARYRFNDYVPLLKLGRLEDARALLQGCRDVFQAEGALPQLGRVFGALASLEDRLGHQQDAIAMTKAALRYGYAAGDPADVATGHFNLAIALQQGGGDPELVVAHRLAAALLFYQIGDGRLTDTLGKLTVELAGFGEQAVPGSFAALCARVGQVEGVRLAELLAGPAADAEAALAAVLRLAREQSTPPSATGPGLLEQWEPVIAAVVAATRGDTQAASALEPLLAELDKTSDWAALASVLRRILDGEQSGQLLDGLDPTDTAIVTMLLDRLGGQPDTPDGP
jgi:hypothetical protein